MGEFLSWDDKARILYIHFEDILDDQVLLDRYHMVREWIAEHGPVSSISDFSDVASFEVTPAGVKALAGNPPLVPDDFRRMVVAPQDLAFGMTRMFEGMGSRTRSDVEVVRSLPEALHLLGLQRFEPRVLQMW